MDLSSLDIFCAVAEEGSITRAAQRLGRAPSNVSTRVQQLEEQLHSPLFQREGKRMQLNAEGERFIGYARRLLTLAQEATAAIRTDEPRGQLRIGAMEATAASRLPAPLASFHQHWPEVALEIATGTSGKLLAELEAHRLDCALVALTPEQEKAGIGDDLEGTPLWQEQLMWLEPKGKPDEQPLNLAAFERGCSYRAAGEAWLASTHPRGVRVVQASSYHAIMASVTAGGCGAVMPQSVLDLYKTPRLKFATRPLMQMNTWLVWRKQFSSGALNAFRQACVATQ